MSKSKICFLHIGVGKTGTTSIQGALYRGRDHLAEHGYLYPGRMRNHTFLTVCAVENRSRWPVMVRKRMDDQESAAAFRQDCLDYLDRTVTGSDCDRVIFSAESLANLRYQDCSQLREILRRYFDRIEIICYLRHPLAHIHSIAQQALKTGTNAHTLTEISRRPGFFRPTRLEQTYIAAFGHDAITVRNFHRDALVKGDVIDDFCATIGMRDTVAAGLQRLAANQSLSMEAALIANAIATELPRLDGGRWNTERSGKLQMALTRISGQAFALPASAADGVADAIDREVVYVRDRFGVTLTPPAEAGQAPGALWNDETLRDIGLLLNAMGKKIETLERIHAFDQAKLLLSGGATDKALQKMDEIARKYPPAPRYFLLLASIHEARREAGKARAALSAGARRFPEHKTLRRKLAGRAASGS